MMVLFGIGREIDLRLIVLYCDMALHARTLPRGARKSMDMGGLATDNGLYALKRLSNRQSHTVIKKSPWVGEILDCLVSSFSRQSTEL